MNADETRTYADTQHASNTLETNPEENQANEQITKVVVPMQEELVEQLILDNQLQKRDSPS
jgi:hypothetical protein